MILEELKTKCGHNILSLRQEYDVYDNGETRYGAIWVAKPRVQPDKRYITDYIGRTPEEALENLWKSMQKKS